MAWQMKLLPFVLHICVLMIRESTGAYDETYKIGTWIFFEKISLVSERILQIQHSNEIFCLWFRSERTRLASDSSIGAWRECVREVCGKAVDFGKVFWKVLVSGFWFPNLLHFLTPFSDFTSDKASLGHSACLFFFQNSTQWKKYPHLPREGPASVGLYIPVHCNDNSILHQSYFLPGPREIQFPCSRASLPPWQRCQQFLSFS